MEIFLYKMANLKIKVGAAVPVNPFSFQVYYTIDKAVSPPHKFNTSNATWWYDNMYFEYQNGKGKYYYAGEIINQKQYIQGTTISYTVMLLNDTVVDKEFIVIGSGFELVRIKFQNPDKINGTFNIPVTLYSNQSKTESATRNFTVTFANEN